MLALLIIHTLNTILIVGDSAIAPNAHSTLHSRSAVTGRLDACANKSAANHVAQFQTLLQHVES